MLNDFIQPHSGLGVLFYQAPDKIRGYLHLSPLGYEVISFVFMCKLFF
jgi:hypothetical protein